MEKKSPSEGIIDHIGTPLSAETPLNHLIIALKREGGEDKELLYSKKKLKILMKTIKLKQHLDHLLVQGMARISDLCLNF